MMRNLLFVFALLLSFGLSAQTLESSPAELTEEFEACPGNKVTLSFEVTNKLTTDVSALWRVDRVDAPEQWELQICDAITCYAIGLEKCPDDRPNDFLPGQTITIYSIKVSIPDDAFDTEGIADFDFVMYNSTDESDVYMTVPMVVTGTVCTSSSDELEVTKDLSIFPNPTFDQFKISKNESVSSLIVYNVIGSEVKRFGKSVNGVYNVSDLTKGMYLVRMFNEGGDLLKVSRLSKR